MNVCMKEICYCHLTYSTVASLPFAIPHGIVMCLLDAHFRISPKILGYYCFINTNNLDILINFFFSSTTYIMQVLIFGRWVNFLNYTPFDSDTHTQ